ncbi:MAG TPA: carboxypeptidase regulatory-like domain-containing protein [Tepidisphaeraceae bacterium]|jgi:hypothetical protein
MKLSTARFVVRPLDVFTPVALILLAMFVRAAGDNAAQPAQAPISGRVEDQQGHPIPGALIDLAAGALHASTRAEADGRFAFDLPPAQQRYGNLWARTPDGKLQTFYSLHDPTGDGSPDAARVRDARLTLKPAREFAVTVTDDKGSAVTGAWVAFSSAYAKAGEATTDAAGQATLRVPADATPQHVVAVKGGVGLDYLVFAQKDRPHTDPYHLDRAFAGPLKFVLNGARHVSVKVVDGQNRPLKGVSVQPWYFEKPRKGEIFNHGLHELFRRTDDQGIAQFDFVPADNTNRVNFWTRLDGYCAPDRCLWDPKSTDPLLQTTLVPMVHVTGRVRGPDGQPAANATVTAAGTGYGFDDFRGQAQTDAAGAFQIDVDPDKYYMFVGEIPGPKPGKPRLISKPLQEVILDHPPVAPIELTLGTPIRVFGRATAGAENTPVPGADVVAQQHDESYYKLPKDQRLPNPKNQNRSVSTMIPVWTKADPKGNYEFFLAPGSYYLYRSGAPSRGGGGWRNDLFTLADGQTELERNLHSDIARGPSLIHGRVVRRDDPRKTVGEVVIEGHHVNLDRISISAVSGFDGSFALRRGESDLYLYGVTPDKKLRGITIVPAKEDSTTLPVGATASARGRLLDHEGNPDAGRQIDYGVRIGPPKGPWSTAFGGHAKTAADGSFTVDGLVPGFDYELSAVLEFGDDGRPRSWMPFGSARAQDGNLVELGDLRLKKPYKPPTPADYIAQAFAKGDPIGLRLDKARHTADACYQNVLVVLSAPDRAPLRRFFELWRDDQDYQVWGQFAEFVTVFVDVTHADNATRAWANQLKLTWPADAGMIFAVFDKAGRLLTQANDADLSIDRKLDRARLMAFAKANGMVLPDARTLLDDALAKAKREDKRVLLDQTGALCGWCVKLADYLQANRQLIDKDYVWVTLDSRMPHGNQILTALRTGEDKGSTPWMAILDADGKPLITGDGPHGNIGYPGEPGSQTHWEKMLRTTARHLTDTEIHQLLDQLRTADGL